MNGREREDIAALRVKTNAMHEDIKEIKSDIKEMKATFFNQVKDCQSHFTDIDHKIWLATGCVTALSVLALTKSVGIW